MPSPRQIEGDRGPGADRTGQDLHLIGYLPHYRQAVARYGWPRVHQRQAGSALRPLGPAVHVTNSWPGRIAGRQRTIVNLAVQRSGTLPYPQPPCSRAVADGVGRQFVNGQDHIPGPALRQPRVTGPSLDLYPQCVQRAGIERQIKVGRNTAACRSRMEPVDAVCLHGLLRSPVRLGRDRLPRPGLPAATRTPESASSSRSRSATRGHPKTPSERVPDGPARSRGAARSQGAAGSKGPAGQCPRAELLGLAAAQRRHPHQPSPPP